MQAAEDSVPIIFKMQLHLALHIFPAMYNSKQRFVEGNVPGSPLGRWVVGGLARGYPFIQGCRGYLFEGHHTIFFEEISLNKNYQKVPPSGM